MGYIIQHIILFLQSLCPCGSCITEIQEFESYDQMCAWFALNGVSEREYVKTTHDCDDFARETQRGALSDGWLVNILPDPNGRVFGDGVSHMLCSCTIGNEIYIIEPQTDEVILHYEMD